MPGRCSKAPRLGIEGTRRRGTFGTKKARSRCPDDARLDALDRREVVGHEMPRLAIVPRVVELTRGRPRVHARGSFESVRSPSRRTVNHAPLCGRPFVRFNHCFPPFVVRYTAIAPSGITRL